MGWWSPPSGLMVREGHELRWDKTRLPLALYVDDAATEWWSYLAACVAEVNACVGSKAIMYPEQPLAIIRDAFVGPQPIGVSGAIYVTVDPLVLNTAACCEPRFDQGTGSIRNALVVLPRKPPLWATAMALHELGHAMGLDHDHEPGSVMAPRLSGRESARFPRPAIDLLRRTYGA